MHLQVPPAKSSMAADSSATGVPSAGNGVLLLEPLGVPALDPRGVLALEPFLDPPLGVPVLDPFSDIAYVGLNLFLLFYIFKNYCFIRILFFNKI